MTEPFRGPGVEPGTDDGRSRVPVYRLFFLNSGTGHIEGHEDVSSADDVGAICLVNERSLPEPAELWLGSRKVIAFGTNPAYAPGPLLPAAAS